MCRLCFWSAGELVSALVRLSAVSLSLRWSSFHYFATVEHGAEVSITI